MLIANQIYGSAKNAITRLRIHSSWLVRFVSKAKAPISYFRMVRNVGKSAKEVVHVSPLVLASLTDSVEHNDRFIACVVRFANIKGVIHVQHHWISWHIYDSDEL